MLGCFSLTHISRKLFNGAIKGHYRNCLHRRVHLSSSRLTSEDFNHILKSLGHKFSKVQVDQILCGGEEHVNVAHIIPDCPIKEVFINQLAANVKIEDRWNIGVNQVKGEISSLVACVVDGHSGKDCAQIVNKAGLEYIAASFLNPDKLENCFQEYQDIPYFTIVRMFHPGQWETLNDSVKALFMKSLFKYMKELLTDENRLINPNVVMKDALMRLDRDMCIPDDKNQLANWFESRPLMRLSLSGAVALFLRIYWLGEEGEKNPTIHVANVGDCHGILVGLDNDNRTFKSVPLSVPHNISNTNEVKRIISEHKADKPDQLVRDGRLLGELAPLRSFGDVRYKWPENWLKELHTTVKLPGNIPECPKPYTNPPYLTAEPELFRHVIRPEKDKFIILGTDGLWDELTEKQVMDIVVNCHPDVSPATELIKHALSNNPDTFEANQLSTHLALKPGIARYFRDDITVMVFKL